MEEANVEGAATKVSLVGSLTGGEGRLELGACQMTDMTVSTLASWIGLLAVMESSDSAECCGYISADESRCWEEGEFLDLEADPQKEAVCTG